LNASASAASDVSSRASSHGMILTRLMLPTYRVDQVVSLGPQETW
jgi:hypothetical protein